MPKPCIYGESIETGQHTAHDGCARGIVLAEDQQIAALLRLLEADLREAMRHERDRRWTKRSQGVTRSDLYVRPCTKESAPAFRKCIGMV
jgi:hypothetical protein